VAQKRVVRAMVGARFHWNPDEPNSCKPLFQKLDIVPVFFYLYCVERAKFVKNYPEKFSLATENSNKNKIVHDCDLFVKKSTLQMTAQDPSVMIARVLDHLPLALKMNVAEKCFATNVEKLVQEFLFYDKSEYFGHKFECLC
jgi:hypothetical protein